LYASIFKPCGVWGLVGLSGGFIVPTLYVLAV
jgi:hypothetical protein